MRHKTTMEMELARSFYLVLEQSSRRRQHVIRAPKFIRSFRQLKQNKKVIIGNKLKRKQLERLRF